MITNLHDLHHMLRWLKANGLPPDERDYSDYPHRVSCAGYQIVATDETEWRVRVAAHVSGVSPFNMAYHLQVAPWVMDEVQKLLRSSP